MKSLRIIGIGNPFAGDDAVGIHVAQRLKTHNFGGVEIFAVSQVGVELLDLMDGAETVILIDAVKSGKDSGTIHCLESSCGMDQLVHLAHSSNTSSTHAFGLGQVLALGQTLGRLPPKLILYGIELGQTTLGRPLSQKVDQAAEQVGFLIANRMGKQVLF